MKNLLLLKTLHILYKKDSQKDVCSIEEFADFFVNFLRSETDEYLKPPISVHPNAQPATKPEEQLPKMSNSESMEMQNLSTSFSNQSSIDRSSNSGRSVSRSLFPPGAMGAGPSQFSPIIKQPFTNLGHMSPGRNLVFPQRFDSPTMRPPIVQCSPYQPVHQMVSPPFWSPVLQSSPPSGCNVRPYMSDMSRQNSTPQTSRTQSPNVSNASTPATKPKEPEKTNTTASPLCLGDFIPTSLSKSSKRSKGKTRDGSHAKSTEKDPAKKVVSTPGNKDSEKKTPRRVVPTQVLNTSQAFTSPAFRSENNLLEVSKDEIVEHVKANTVDERGLLKSELTAIKQAFQEESPKSSNKPAQTPTPCVKDEVDLTLVTHKKTLNKLINIYTSLIDLNLTMYILSELSFLLSLVNMDMKPVKQNEGNPSPEKFPWEHVFKNKTNCVYFALGVLNKEKSNFAFFDVTTLRVIFENERLASLDENFKQFLESVYQQKIQIESKSIRDKTFPSTRNFQSVFFQEENDARSNFPSDREFTAFRKQRDTFYEILKIWEQQHLEPTFEFSNKLKSKVCSLLSILNHPINMAHLAKLFVSQLIISSHFTDTSSDLETALPNVDLNKLTKLQQRLVAPSDFSTDYQFPGHQAFFRDFLISADNSIVFIEQLKIALAAELIELNDSSYEIFNLSSNSKDGKTDYNEYVVRPETLQTMRILAKFLGFVVCRPFNYETRNAHIDSRQIELRNMLNPCIDVYEIFKKAINEGKVVITIPWIIEYLSVLDYVTVRLSQYRRLLQSLYDLYMLLSAKFSVNLLHMHPTSVFILRSCLGWLFEQQNFIEFKYGYNRSKVNAENLFVYRDYKELTVLIPRSFYGNFMSNDKLILASVEEKDSSKDEFKCSLVKKQNSDKHLSDELNSKSIDTPIKTFDPTLESIINVACPFLADFRVSIMPTKVSKSVSRTGRLRHITTKYSQPPITTTNNHQESNDPQTKLIEAFLHSQSLSVRKIIEFVIERTTSAVVKDYQMEILIPSKDNAHKMAREISSNEVDYKGKIIKIFTDAYKQAMVDWDREIPKLIQSRAAKAMDALLPNETLDAVKKTCISLVISKCIKKTEEWKEENLKGIEFYTRDFSKNNPSKNLLTVDSTILEIDLSKLEPHAVLSSLQMLLHRTSLRLELVNFEDIQKLFDNLVTFLDTQILPASAIRALFIGTIYLGQNLVKNFPQRFDSSLMHSLVQIWKNEKLQNFIIISNAELPVGDVTQSQQNVNSIEDNQFGEFVSTYFIQSLGENTLSFECLSKLLIAIATDSLAPFQYLQNQLNNVLKNTWPDSVQILISRLLMEVESSAAVHQCIK